MADFGANVIGRHTLASLVALANATTGRPDACIAET